MLNAHSLADLNPVIEPQTASCAEFDQYACAQQEVTDLNTAFLSFAFATDWFPETLIKRFAQISQSQRHRIACLPFSLFTMDFADAEVWRTECQQLSQVRDTSIQLASKSALTFDVLSYAWHLSRTETSTSGRLLLGLSSAVAAEVESIAPSKLSFVAYRCQSRLRPRWLEHTRFWSTLIDSVSEEAGMERVQLWGRQLMAAEQLFAPRRGNTFKSRMELKGRLLRCS